MQYYLYVLRVITGRKPRGVLYNVLRRPQLRQKKDETFSEFIMRVGVDLKERPEHYFHRWEVPVSEDEMDAFERDLAIYVKDFIAWHEGSLSHYKNPRACLQPWACEFLPICGAGRREGFYTRERLFQELDV